ncbi:MAG TPA: hypothetical protein VIK20_01920 [Bacteroidales bacterium]
MIKDINLTAKRQRVEWLVFGVCFLLAFTLNVVSVILYKTEWKELYTQLGWVFVISLFLYFSTLLIRMFYQFVFRTFIQKRLSEKKKH